MPKDEIKSCFQLQSHGEERSESHSYLNSCGLAGRQFSISGADFLTGQNRDLEDPTTQGCFADKTEVHWRCLDYLGESGRYSYETRFC